MRVVKHREGGVVRRVVLHDEAGVEIVPITRFLSHLCNSNYSPNTVCAYAYDLAHLARFLDQHALSWDEFRPSTPKPCPGCKPTSSRPNSNQTRLGP